ncbi:Uncharacterised protein [Pseudomonas aeruginosa]|nr:Uncharacterised protein [Pseudomonas aeruginosa]
MARSCRERSFRCRGVHRRARKAAGRARRRPGQGRGDGGEAVRSDSSSSVAIQQCMVRRSEEVVLKAGKEGSPIRTLYTAPPAQAQQLHDLDKQCRDDVARALGLRPSQERGFAWSYLLASIKSCVKAAQAQHSVPEGWMLVECGIWTQEQVDEMQRTVARFRSSEFVDDRALAMAVAGRRPVQGSRDIAGRAARRRARQGGRS